MCYSIILLLLDPGLRSGFCTEFAALESPLSGYLAILIHASVAMITIGLF